MAGTKASTIRKSAHFLQFNEQRKNIEEKRKQKEQQFKDLNLIGDAESYNLIGEISRLYQCIIDTTDKIRKIDSTPKTEALLSETLTLADGILESKVHLDQVTDFVNNKLPPHFGDNTSKNHWIGLSNMMCVLAGLMLIAATAMPLVLVASGVIGAGLGVIAMMTGFIVGVSALKVSINTLKLRKQKDFIQSEGLKNNLNTLFTAKANLDQKIPEENRDKAYKLLGYRS